MALALRAAKVVSSMLLPAPAIAATAHANEGYRDRVHRPIATIPHHLHSKPCCLKKQQTLLWLTPRYETISDSLVQLLEVGTDTHQEQTELRIQKQPAAILPEQYPQQLALLQKEAVAEIVSAALPPYEYFLTRGEVQHSRIRPPGLAVMGAHRREPSAPPAIFHSVKLVVKIASAKDHQPPH